MAVYKTDLDYEFLKDATTDDIVGYVKENFVADRFLESPTFKFKKRYRVLDAICKMLQITPNNEQWVFLLAECDRLLCEACAGAGKTTMAQLKLIDAKLTHNIQGKNIIALAYNTHAVSDMKSRHYEIMTRLDRMNIPELHRDRELMCSTFHSFCRQWVWDYLSDLGFASAASKKNNIIMDDAESMRGMELALESYIKKHPDEKLFISDGIKKALISLYTYAHETLSFDNTEVWKLSSAMSDLKEMPIPTIQAVFAMYDKYKKLRHMMDFADVVNNFWLLCQRPDVIERIRTNYSVMLVDEYQDITPAMLRIIHIIMEGNAELGISPYKDGVLICIGDGDQSIYGFRGTDPDNCIRFKEMYGTAESDMMVRITSMSENRRCPSNIIDIARAIITSNDKRIDKPILSIRDGGEVFTHEYSGAMQEFDLLIDELKTLNPAQLSDSCICYRNRTSSDMLLARLVEAGISVKPSSSCNGLFQDRLSTSLRDIFNMLSYPDNIMHIQKALYKVLPRSRTFHQTALNNMLEAEEVQRKAGGENHRFWELPFDGSTWGINGFKEAMNVLTGAYAMHRRNTEMSKYVPDLIKLIRMYYLNWILQKTNSMSEEYLAYVINFHSKPVSYDGWSRDYKRLRDNLDEDRSKGIYLTTFHGLKGLEFDRLFVVDLNDMIFPGTDLNMTEKLSQSQKDTIENETRRLFYVTVTRAKNYLHMFFDRECPTRYIRFFKENQGIAKNYKDYISSGDFTEESGFLRFEKPESEELSFDLGLGLDPMDSADATALAETILAENNLGKTSNFGSPSISDLILDMDTKDNELRKNIGDAHYQAVDTKPRLKSLLGRIMEDS